MKSPPRSTVSTAASSNPLAKNPLAAWAWWWPTLATFPLNPYRRTNRACFRHKLQSM
jgi:hypothetical protein